MKMKMTFAETWSCANIINSSDLKHGFGQCCGSEIFFFFFSDPDPTLTLISVPDSNPDSSPDPACL
jgi:hypothetical protein